MAIDGPFSWMNRAVSFSIRLTFRRPNPERLSLSIAPACTRSPRLSNNHARSAQGVVESVSGKRPPASRQFAKVAAVPAFSGASLANALNTSATVAGPSSSLWPLIHSEWLRIVGFPRVASMAARRIWGRVELFFMPHYSGFTILDERPYGCLMFLPGFLNEQLHPSARSCSLEPGQPGPG